MMGNNHPYILSDRISFLISKFTKKYKLDKPRIQWDESELCELSKDLSQYVRNSIAIWNRNGQRLDHMRLRLLQVASSEDEDIADVPPDVDDIAVDMTPDDVLPETHKQTGDENAD